MPGDHLDLEEEIPALKNPETRERLMAWIEPLTTFYFPRKVADQERKTLAFNRNFACVITSVVPNPLVYNIGFGFRENFGLQA